MQGHRNVYNLGGGLMCWDFSEPLIEIGLIYQPKISGGPVPMSHFLPAALALEKAKADSNRAIRKEFSTLHPINDAGK